MNQSLKWLKLSKIASNSTFIDIMSDSFEQSVSFKLDKPHFQECFEQSAPPIQNKDYAKAAILGVVSIGLIFVEAEHYYIPFFLFGLAILELFSIHYRQTWWVWRQLMGKNANGKVTLVVNSEGITTQSEYVNTQILWADINQVEKTEKGLLLRYAGGVNYLSNSYLNTAISEYILDKSEAKLCEPS